MEDELYKEILLDHYRNPRNRGRLPAPAFAHKELNASCGDSVELFLRIEGGRIVDASFEGRGCVMSMAGASMLTERLKGMTLEEAMRLDQKSVFEMLGVDVGPARARCALLSLKTLQKGLEAREKGEK